MTHYFPTGLLSKACFGIVFRLEGLKAVNRTGDRAALALFTIDWRGSF